METVLNIEVSVLESCPYREVGLYIYFTNISEGTVFLLQGLAYNDEVKLRGYNLKYE